jgi:hypothetical protein
MPKHELFYYNLFVNDDSFQNATLMNNALMVCVTLNLVLVSSNRHAETLCLDRHSEDTILFVLSIGNKK